MRNYDRSQKSRKVTYSEDGGLTWGDIASDKKLIEPICQASMLMVKSSKEDAPILLFLNPAHKKSRQNITLRSSLDDGKSWKGSLVLHKGPGAYSDLSLLSNGNIACLYEAGHANPYQGIVFEVVPLHEIEQATF